MEQLNKMGERARAAASVLAVAGTTEKDNALTQMASALISCTESILRANEEDVEAARRAGISESLIDRLSLSHARLAAMAQGITDLIALPDPIGEIVGGGIRPNGLRIQQTRVPLGVCGIIFEARPNVTSDAAALCLKAGNAVILRGGKEALQSNLAIVAALRKGLAQAGLPEDAVQLIDDISHETAAAMMKMNGYLDVLIPRGGAGLIRTVVQNATVPVIETGTGNCHIYVDKAADIAMAAAIAVNAKASRPSVCNAAETLLVHRDIADEALPVIARGMAEKNVQLRCDESARAILGDQPFVTAVTPEDYATEFLDYIMAVRVVDSLEEAVAHITRYGTHHSECIVTGDYAAAEQFTATVDAAAVYVNASTRFTDGGEFGLGAEIGISTQKLHARGPMGLRTLTTIKYIVYGNGQIR